MNADVPSFDLIEVAQFVMFWMTVTGVGHVTLVAILPDGPTTARTFHRGDDHEMATWVADAQRAGRNIYFQPNETFPDCASKPAKTAMMAGLSRFADIDPSRWLSPRRRARSAGTPRRSSGRRPRIPADCHHQFGQRPPGHLGDRPRSAIAVHHR